MQVVNRDYDLIIIGAGVTGAALAYRLARYDLKILWLEKENDVSLGASRANTAIIHGGYDPEPNTLMGRFNTRGAQKCMELCELLDVEYKKTGSLIIAFNEAERAHLEKLYQRGLDNQVPNMEILEGDEVRRREPHLSQEVVAALWVPESGVINPWEFTLAMAEVAVRNGVDLRLNHRVEAIKPLDGDGYEVSCAQLSEQGILKARPSFTASYVVNAAGVYSDQIHNMVAEAAFQIEAARGEYFLLDRAGERYVEAVVFQCPSALGKGVLVSPTVHDNILVGPNSEVVSDREDCSVSREALDQIAVLARRSVPDLAVRHSIRNYAGIRANSSYGDFYIRMVRPHFLDMAAIKSPGLTCAPINAEYAEGLLREEGGLELKPKADFRDGRRIVRFKALSHAERAELIRRDPLYGRIICRCETISEGEIRDALAREIKPVSLDAVKRRCGSGMGRCQGGFCGPRILDLLCKEGALRPEQVMNDKAGSYILFGPSKQRRAQS